MLRWRANATCPETRGGSLAHTALINAPLQRGVNERSRRRSLAAYISICANRRAPRRFRGARNSFRLNVGCGPATDSMQLLSRFERRSRLKSALLSVAAPPLCEASRFSPGLHDHSKGALPFPRHSPDYSIFSFSCISRPPFCDLATVTMNLPTRSAAHSAHRSAAATEVAQTSSLLCRRFPIGMALATPNALLVPASGRLEALRYGRLEICATTAPEYLRGLRRFWAILKQCFGLGGHPSATLARIPALREQLSSLMAETSPAAAGTWSVPDETLAEADKVSATVPKTSATIAKLSSSTAETLATVQQTSSTAE